MDFVFAWFVVVVNCDFYVGYKMGTIESVDIDEIIGYAKEQIKKDGDHVPLFIVSRGDGDTVLIAMQFDSGEAKVAAREKLKEYVEKTNAPRYACVFTAWMSQNDGCDVRPSEDAERKEILLVFQFDKDGLWDYRACEILRTESNNVLFGDDVSLGTGQHKNRWNVYGTELYDFGKER